MGMCEKIFQAMGGGSAPQSKHRISDSHHPSPNFPGLNPSLTAPEIAEMVPIMFDPPLPPASASSHISNNMNKQVGKHARKIEFDQHKGGGHKETGETGMRPGFENINDRSSDYITRAKKKLRAVSSLGPKRAASNVGRLRSSSEMDHNNDKFSEFINRAKMRMRATSNVGHGRSSPKVDHTNDKFSDYIKRARAKIRTTSHVGAARNDSNL